MATATRRGISSTSRTSRKASCVADRAAQGRTYNLVGDETVSVCEIAAIVRDSSATSRSSMFRPAGRPGRLQISGRRAWDELGWRADTTFADGVARYIAPLPGRMARRMPRRLPDQRQRGDVPPPRARGAVVSASCSSTTSPAWRFRVARREIAGGRRAALQSHPHFDHSSGSIRGAARAGRPPLEKTP